MDDVTEQQQYEEDEIVAINGEEHERGIEPLDNVDDSAVDDDIKHSIESRDSSAGKLFVGGVSWETTEEAFTNYFSKYGEITDSVIMRDKHSGRPRGFGFVTFADPEAADKVLEEEHILGGRTVEVKRTVPREDMQQVKAVSKTKKIFIGGIPTSLTEDELKEYFSCYGSIVEHLIMLDRETGRSRGFGFVTFESEDSVEKIFSEGKTHELGGKEVEIKKAEPKRGGGDYSGGAGRYGSGSNSRGGYKGKMSRGYDDYGGYDGYGNYGGGYGGGSAGFYGGYGYGYGFGGAMYGGAGYGAAGYGGTPASYGTPAGYGSAAWYGGGAGGRGRGGGGYGSDKGYGNGGVASGRGRGGGGYDSDNKGYGSGGAISGRYHPY